jgi:hypothetical protein
MDGHVQAVLLQSTDRPIAFAAVLAVSLLFLLAIGLDFLVAESALGGGPDAPASGPNCADCGAPNPAGRDRCKHCDSRLGGDA